MPSGRREALILVAAGVASAAAGFLAGPVLLRSPGETQALRAAELVDLAGKPRRLSEWQGRVLVCNFWATWCAPCREEIPLLMAGKEKYGSSGVEIIGIAIDNAHKVVEFTRTVPISYTILLAETTGLGLMRELGNNSGGLPYTVFLDRQGRLAHRKLGVLKRGELDSILDPMARS